MRLSRKHHRAILTLQNQRLVSIDVAGGWDDVYTGPDFCLTVEQFVSGARVIDKVLHRVVASLRCL